jgi:uncharacterized membrane protein (DUF4010 family)
MSRATLADLGNLDGRLSVPVALGIGLLIGVERERRKGSGETRGAAGIRTFALVGLLGGLCAQFDDALVLAVGAGFVGAAAVAAYVTSRPRDPGLTTEVALLVTFLLGALAHRDIQLASGLAVVVTVLLASRSSIHRFVKRVLTEDELNDALVVASAALVVLPLLPNRAVGPYGVLNPVTVWRLVVVIIGVSALGYVARRTLGSRLGLPLAGAAGGFISAAATIGGMGRRAREEPSQTAMAVAGALLANVATVVLLAVVLAIAHLDTLATLAVALVAAGVTAAGFGALATWRSWRAGAPPHTDEGRAFHLATAVVFAATLTGVLMLAAALTDRAGSTGLVLGVGLAGLADSRSAAISAGALASSGSVTSDAAALAVVVAFTANTLTKILVARATGTSEFVRALVPGLVTMVAVAWVGFLAVRLI